MFDMYDTLCIICIIHFHVQIAACIMFNVSSFCQIYCNGTIET